MKTELVDVNETRKNLMIEIPPDVVDAEIDKVTAKYRPLGAHPGLPPRQSAAQGDQAALQESDPS